MKTPIINVDGRTGCIFEGEVPDTYCFVPEEYIFAEGAGLRVDEIDYVRDHWDLRNMRCNDEVDGQHLFPNSRRPVVGEELENGQVKTFLRRIGGNSVD